MHLDLTRQLAEALSPALSMQETRHSGEEFTKHRQSVAPRFRRPGSRSDRRCALSQPSTPNDAYTEASRLRLQIGPLLLGVLLHNRRYWNAPLPPSPDEEAIELCRTVGLSGYADSTEMLTC